MLVDEDEELQGRIEGERGEIEGALGMNIRILDGSLKQEISSMKKERPDDSHRDQVRGNWPIGIFYTRYDLPPRLAVALMGYSGTTGFPKGVPFNHDRFFQSGCHVWPPKCPYPKDELTSPSGYQG